MSKEPTIYEVVAAKLGQAPTNAELTRRMTAAHTLMVRWLRRSTWRRADCLIVNSWHSCASRAVSARRWTRYSRRLKSVAISSRSTLSNRSCHDDRHTQKPLVYRTARVEAMRQQGYNDARYAPYARQRGSFDSASLYRAYMRGYNDGKANGEVKV